MNLRLSSLYAYFPRRAIVDAFCLSVSVSTFFRKQRNQTRPWIQSFRFNPFRRWMDGWKGYSSASAKMKEDIHMKRKKKKNKILSPHTTACDGVKEVRSLGDQSPEILHHMFIEQIHLVCLARCGATECRSLF